MTPRLGPMDLSPDKPLLSNSKYTHRGNHTFIYIWSRNRSDIIFSSVTVRAHGFMFFSFISSSTSSLLSPPPFGKYINMQTWTDSLMGAGLWFFGQESLVQCDFRSLDDSVLLWELSGGDLRCSNPFEFPSWNGIRVWRLFRKVQCSLCCKNYVRISFFFLQLFLNSSFEEWSLFQGTVSVMWIFFP